MAEDQTTSSSEVIDLTSSSSANDDDDDAAANITPDRPTKRVRMSRRVEARQQQRALLKKRSNDGTGVKYHGTKKGDAEDVEETVDVDDDDTPQYEGKHINGYFEVDEVLDRRTRKYGSESAGLRHVVEYCKFVCYNNNLCIWCAHDVYVHMYDDVLNNNPLSYYCNIW